MNNSVATHSYMLALGEYEKQVILELDKLPAYKQAHLYKTRQDASLLFFVIATAWEGKVSLQDCLLRIHTISLLLLRGNQPAFDAIANITKEYPTNKATPMAMSQCLRIPRGT